MPINWTEIEDAIHASFVSATGMTATKVLWGEQANPQPVRPFATLKIMSGPVRLGGVDEVRKSYNPAAPLQQEITHEVSGQREITVECQVFSDNVHGANAARAILSKLQTGLFLPTIRYALNTAGLSLMASDSIVDLTAIVATKFQSRANLDLRFNLVDTASQLHGYIETAQVAGDYT